MNRGQFDFEKNKPIFQTPKYTGVTLSLLSMFVLVCMFAVWDKIPKQDSPLQLSVLASKIAEQPLISTQKEFEKELGIKLSVRFEESLNENKIKHLTQNTDLYILEKNSIPKSKGPVFSKLTSLTLAHKEIEDRNLTVVAGINTARGNSVLAFQFARYLAAPSRGQFNFAKHGWTVMDSDTWYLIPEIKIWAENGISSNLNASSKSFEKIEGAKVNIEIISVKDMVQSLEIIGKSNSRKFLPDLIWSSNELLNNFNVETLALSVLEDNHASKKSSVCLVNESSFLSQTARRFFHHSSSLLGTN